MYKVRGKPPIPSYQYGGSYTAPKTNNNGPAVSSNAELEDRYNAQNKAPSVPKINANPAAPSYSYGGFGLYDPFEGKTSPDTVRQIFQAALGRPPTPQELSSLSYASYDRVAAYVRDTAAATGGGGGGGGGGGFSLRVPTRDELFARARAIWESMGVQVPLSEGEFQSWLDKGWLETADGELLIKERIRSLPAFHYGTVSKTERIIWREDYESMTGRKMDDALAKTRDDMYQDGYTRTQWQDYVKRLPEYQAGPERMSMKQTYLDALYDSWGVGVVDQLLLENPNYLEEVVFPALGEGQSYAVIADWARQQPQWTEGPQAAVSRENLYDTYTGIMRVQPDRAWLDERVLEGWNPAQLEQYLRDTPQYQKMYAGKPAYMSEKDFWGLKDGFNGVGRWYYGQAGTLQYLSGGQVQQMRDEQGITSPDILPYGVYADEEGRYVTWSGGWQMSDAQLGAMIDAGWTPGEWEQYLRYQEMGWAELDRMNFLGEAIGKTYSQEDAVAMVSWAQGSGKTRAELQRAENRRSFDTAFAILTDRKPTLADYEYLEANFVSPEHYYQTGIAQFKAEAQFPDADKLFRRVYGYGADMERLVDVNLMRPGSGYYQAMLQAAEELDRYTLPFKLYHRRNPTPQDYAGFLDMAGPDELVKEITVREMMKAEGPSIRKIYNSYWVPQGADALSEEDLQTLIGKYEGWGAIQARLTLAEERRRSREQSVAMSLRWGAAVAPVAFTEFGGPKLPGLRRIGG